MSTHLEILGRELGGVLVDVAAVVGRLRSGEGVELQSERTKGEWAVSISIPPSGRIWTLVLRVVVKSCIECPLRYSLIPPGRRNLGGID